MGRKRIPIRVVEWTTANKDRLEKERIAFGSAIRARRIQLDVTQAALAKDLGISFKTLHGVEAGRSWPSCPLYFMLAKALNAGPLPFVS